MVDKSLLGSRNLVDSDIGPLRKLTGILDSVPTEIKEYGEGEAKQKRTQAVLNLKEIEVIESVEAYHYPTYSTRPFTISNRKKSRWGVLMDSFNEYVDPILYTKEQLQAFLADGAPNPSYVKPEDRMDFTDCIGKRIGLVMADSTEDKATGRPMAPMLFDGRADDGKGADVPTPTWRIYWVEGLEATGGASAANPTELAMTLLDGKTASDFNQAIIAEEGVRSDTGLMAALSKVESDPQSFLAQMVSTGRFTVDENQVYHKAGG